MNGFFGDGKNTQCAGISSSLFVFGALNYANAGFGAVRGSCHKIRMSHFHVTPESGNCLEFVPTNDA